MYLIGTVVDRHLIIIALQLLTDKVLWKLRERLLVWEKNKSEMEKN